MSVLSSLFNGRFRADPFPHLRDSEADAVPKGSPEAKAAVLRVQAQLCQPTPPAARIPRVIPSRRR